MTTTAEWAPGPAFAEVAEALHIRTNQVVAIMDGGEDTLVTFTTADLKWPPVFAVACQRDLDGVLRVVDEPVSLPAFWAGVRRLIEQDA